MCLRHVMQSRHCIDGPVNAAKADMGMLHDPALGGSATFVFGLRRHAFGLQKETAAKTMVARHLSPCIQKRSAGLHSGLIERGGVGHEQLRFRVVGLKAPHGW